VKTPSTPRRSSSRTNRDDQVALPAAVKRDEIYSYDKLNRVLQNLRGTIVSGSISNPDETEKWGLDPLGNWTTYQFDGDGDGNFTSGADLNDARSYASPAGLANEITEWDPYPANSGNNPVEPVYDRAGNMTDDNYQYVYTYDAWNRLVKVEDQGVTPAVVGAYAYDGLNRRITRTIGSDDPIHEYYTESWQRIESRPNGESSTQGVSLFVFGIRYIDDIVMRQRDANATGPAEERRYYLTDANYNVSMIVTDAGYGVERVFYTAYGEPEVFPFGDADGDYDVDTADETLITSIKNSTDPYNILADLNLDGAVTQADLNVLGNYTGALGGRGVLTASNGSATTGNDIGYAGYTWNDERAQWHVRHREYDPKLGRWLTPDPFTYVSGYNWFEYVATRPLLMRDPSGLQPVPVMPPPTVRPAPRVVPFRTIDPGQGWQPIWGPAPGHLPYRDWQWGDQHLPPNWRERLIPKVPSFSRPGEGPFYPMPKIPILQPDPALEPDPGRPNVPCGPEDLQSGDCLPGEADEIYGRQKQCCDREVRSCEDLYKILPDGGNSRSELCKSIRDRITSGICCANARWDMMIKCFRGGNSGHRHAYNEAVKVLNKCMSLYRLRCFGTFNDGPEDWPYVPLRNDDPSFDPAIQPSLPPREP